ncbi:SLCO3A [Mytilus edulis]|uniref:Solute carrier organic anion transporter family member n=1 Tax=Mytilus edulis TaxID=6550 RepID=A0A8S3RK06_MYTED|nr:SLCO3A [Mytilus edulis]
MAARPDLKELENLSIHIISENVETPGGISVGQQSSVSDFSVGSQSQFLKGKTEKDEYVKACLQVDIEVVDEIEEDKPCGIGRCRPNGLQTCANIKTFVTCMCLLMVTTGTMSTGYFNSVITTIEKRFEIGSSISGLIVASYEFGSLVTVIFISYLGGRRHIPKWISYGIFLMSLGAFLFALPHIIAKKYTVHRGISHNETEENICKVVDDLSGQYKEKCIGETSGNWVYVLILISAQILIGTGGTPVLTLGTTYVDNHVPKDKAPAYLAFIYASGVLGPVLGYALGALLLQYYVDVFSYIVNIRPSDPQWIGAWWGGFLICGILLFVLAFPFLSFPRILVEEKRKILEVKTKEELLNQDDRTSKHGEEYGKTIRDIPRSMLNLLKNKIYVLTSLGICCEIAIVSGFVVFLPKYLETQFGTSKSMNLFTGGIGIPGAVVGILVGGFILKRFQLHPKGAIKLALVLDALALSGFVLFMVLGCENVKMAGATFPYHAYVNSTDFDDYGFDLDNAEANLTSTCNMNCDCSQRESQPICGINGITYFSPCHAGCTRFYSYITPEEKLMNFSGCTCIMDNPVSPEVIVSPVATNGPCKSTCHNLYPFLFLLVVVTFTVAGTQMPLLMVTLRSVHEEEKSFALGLQFVILRLFAYIPAPIMFGNTIDTSCLVWNTKCGNHGSCLLYDIVQFRYKYVGVSAGLKCLGAILFFSVWVLMYIRDKEDTGTITVRDIFNSVSSVERMDLDYDQRHYKHPKDKKSEVKHSGDGESDKQFSEPDQWNRKLKYRHKSSEAGDDVPCEPTVFSSMLDTESTV